MQSTKEQPLFPLKGTPKDLARPEIANWLHRQWQEYNDPHNSTDLKVIISLLLQRCQQLMKQRENSHVGVVYQQPYSLTNQIVPGSFEIKQLFALRICRLSGSLMAITSNSDRSIFSENYPLNADETAITGCKQEYVHLDSPNYPTTADINLQERWGESVVNYLLKLEQLIPEGEEHLGQGFIALNP